ncbi:translocation/assembly module TamB domain-containing protein [Bordetella sp. 2513F-2]
MKALRAVLRHVVVWWLPGLVMVATLAVALLFWLAGTQHGTRMLLGGAVELLGGEARDVRGTLLRGLDVGSLRLAFDGTEVDVTGLRLDVDWRALRHRRLHVREVSAGQVKVALAGAAPAPEDPAAQPPGKVALPVAVAVDRFAVGAFSLTQDGQPLPVALHDLVASLAADAQGARLQIASLHMDHPWARAALQGDMALTGLADPWPFQARLDVSAWGTGADSPLCVNAWMARNGLAQAVGAADADPTDCPVQMSLQADGSLDVVDVTVDGQGGALGLQARTGLAPRAAFPLRNANLLLSNDGKRVLAATLDWQAVGGEPGVDRVVATLQAEKLDVGGLLGPGMPAGVLSARAGLDAEVANLQTLRRASLDLVFDEGSRWNGQPLSGKLAGRLQADAPAAGSAPAAPPVPGLPAGWRIDGLDTDLRLGPNRVQASGMLGATAGKLALDVNAPRLAAFWPGLPGAVTLKAALDGVAARHRATLQARYAPPQARADRLGQAPVRANLELQGGWGEQPGEQGQPALAGWRGTLGRLEVDTAGFGLKFGKPLDVAILPGAQPPRWQAEIGATTLLLGFPDRQQAVLQHGGSRVAGGRWETKGSADNLVITAAMVRQVLRALDPAAAERARREARHVHARQSDAVRRIALDLDWDLRFAGALSGTARIARRDGDLMIPGDPPIALGLRRLALQLKATPTGAATSRLEAALDVATEKMGTIGAQASAVLNGLALGPRQPIRASLDADIDDLAWVGLFTGDSIEVGGQVDAALQAQGTLEGKWSASGSVRGERLRVVRVDDGVRLIDGTLRARLDGDRFFLDSLRFPASLRVMPDEWRTRTWITSDPDAKNGYIEASGVWELSASRGNVDLTLHRFPALQRSDRYAMISGKVALQAELPRLVVTGDLKADAGWVSLEILQGVPTLDDDVRVVRAGEEEAASTPMQLAMNLNFDMGPRFYITGMGLDAGVVGSIRVMMAEGRLTGMGALRTRGGGIEAYGQKLRLRRGTITFQGRIDNPLLDIEALRTGDQVEAGVRVSGTAQRPRIDLVSYPDVSDVEKLSWLVLGRGPDEGGGDTALLLSVGTALLGGGQPFYRQFGLDDVSVRSGAIGSSGSLLPDRTVAGDVNQVGDSDLSTQFLVASKHFANGITLSVEQALAGTETVGRASYRLARGLSLDLKAGGVNGLALVYRVLIDD